MEEKSRLDSYISDRGLEKSRERAKSLILDGNVLVNGRVAKKPSVLVDDSDKIEIIRSLEFVSRGGLKLKAALRIFGLSPEGKTCLDIGSSTGGFTECLLKRGAEKVFAVDVGKDQFDKTMENFDRVCLMEETDIRDLGDEYYGFFDFTVCDVSFISLKYILIRAVDLMKDGSDGVFLIKPQFELGKDALSKNGVVRNEKDRNKAVENVIRYAVGSGLKVMGTCVSPIAGKEGNIEFFIWVKK